MPSSTAATTPLTEKEIIQVRRFLSDPTVFPANYRTWLTSWIEANPPLIPISQIIGFGQFLANYATAAGTVTTTSTTYASLTGGPTLSSLADGNYLILVGCKASIGVTNKLALISPSVNSATPTDADGAGSAITAVEHSVMAATVAALSNGGANTIEAKYRTTDAAATASFVQRYVVALKYANL